MTAPQNPFLRNIRPKGFFEERYRVLGEETLPIDTDNDGWTGADAAYNRMLPNGNRLWVFGDTLLGKAENGVREVNAMMRTSVGIETSDGNIRYYWGDPDQPFTGEERIGDGDVWRTAEGLFHNHREGEWYWPADVVMADGKACFFMRRMEYVDRKLFPFDVVGNDLIIVDNPTEIPENWRMSVKQIDDSNRTVGVAAEIKDGNVYMIVNEPKGDVHGFHFARIPLKEFFERPGAFQFYNPDSRRWQYELPEETFLEAGAPEASLAFDKAKNNWRIIYTNRAVSPYIMMRESVGDSITGLWKWPEKLCETPEMREGENNVTYAGKEVHGAPELTVTCTTNSFRIKDLLDQAGLYVPKLFTIEPIRQQERCIA